ncbi:MAG: rhodanese-like domain-containing protein [Erythrobacter sp.]
MRKTYPLLLTALTLALAACGGEAQSQGSKSHRGAPPGLELAMLAAAGTAGDVVEVSAQQVSEELAKGSIRLIDIRTAEELAEDPPIPGAEHIPADALDAAVLDNGDGREVVLYCQSGRRSAEAAATLAESTGKPVTHMAGGVLAWQDRVRLAACPEGNQQSC